MTIVVSFIVLVLTLLILGYMPLTLLAGIVSLGLMYLSEQPATSAPADVVGVIAVVLMILAVIFDARWRKVRIAHDREQKLRRQAEKELALEAIKEQIRTHKA